MCAICIMSCYKFNHLIQSAHATCALKQHMYFIKHIDLFVGWHCSLSSCFVLQPEGETQYYNKAVFVDLRNKQSFQTTVNLDIPQNIVAGSEMVEVSAVGM